MFKSLLFTLGSVTLLTSSVLGQQSATEPAIKLGEGAYIAGAPAQMSAEETAKQLANPNTPLASLTLKNHFIHWHGDLLGGESRDSQTFLFQPSFPFPRSAQHGGEMAGWKLGPSCVP